MKHHDFIPLVTFRGWNKKNNNWIFGSLVKPPRSSAYFIWDIEYDQEYEVEYDSLGIYTGKDDKNGTPIFCGVAGAKYGGDRLKHIDDSDMEFISKFDGFSFGTSWPEGEEFEDFDLSPSDEYKVIGNQYEQHLKEQQ